jgi:hypothetical protein
MSGKGLVSSKLKPHQAKIDELRKQIAKAVQENKLLLANQLFSQLASALSGHSLAEHNQMNDWSSGKGLGLTKAWKPMVIDFRNSPPHSD